MRRQILRGKRTGRNNGQTIVVDIDKKDNGTEIVVTR